MRKHVIAALATCSIFFALGATAAAQIRVPGVKAMEASGTAAAGAKVMLTAAVERGTTAGRGCLSIRGLVNGKKSWEAGCGALTVVIDDALNIGRVSGSLTTSYGTYGSGKGCNDGVCVKGSHQVSPDATMLATGSRPGVYVFSNWNTQACQWAYLWLCLVSQTLFNPDDRVLSRDGSSSGSVAGSTFGRSSFSGTGTLYLQHSASQP